HEQSAAARRLTVVGEVRAEGDVRRDVREDRLDLLEVPEHRVTERRLAVALLPATPEAGLRSGRVEVHELRRTGNGERLQQHLMEHGKDAGGRADPKREREDRDPRDEGGSEQRSEGEGEAAHRVVRRGKPLTRLPARAAATRHPFESARATRVDEAFYGNKGVRTARTALGERCPRGRRHNQN